MTMTSQSQIDWPEPEEGPEVRGYNRQCLDAIARKLAGNGRIIGWRVKCVTCARTSVAIEVAVMRGGTVTFVSEYL